MLLTFGEGSRGHRQSARRLARQGLETSMFDDSLAIDLKCLREFFPQFLVEHAALIKNSPRGYGYWIWKPFIIRETLRNLPKNWNLAYLDGGCVLNNTPAAKFRFEKYKKYAVSNSIWATELVARPGEDFRNKSWCKADALRYLKSTSEIEEMAQVQAGILLISNDAVSRELVERWWHAAISDSYRYLDDSPSDISNGETFIEHRHDQALFSILYRQFGLKPVPDETWFPGRWHTVGSGYPIWSPRWTFTFPFKPESKVSFRARIETNRRLGIRKILKKILHKAGQLCASG